MSDQTPQATDWLDDFEDLANRELADGSSCEQVHPIVERWYRQLMQREPHASRASVLQAMACLSTEVLYDSPEDIRSEILKHVDEDAFARWIEYVLMIGRSFEGALRNGDLDDL